MPSHCGDIAVTLRLQVRDILPLDELIRQITMPELPQQLRANYLFVPRHGQSAPLVAPELAPCASSGRAWWLQAARHSQGDAQPLGPQPPPRGLTRAASRVADFTAFDHLGATRRALDATVLRATRTEVQRYTQLV